MGASEQLLNGQLQRPGMRSDLEGAGDRQHPVSFLRPGRFQDRRFPKPIPQNQTVSMQMMPLPLNRCPLPGIGLRRCEQQRPRRFGFPVDTESCAGKIEEAARPCKTKVGRGGVVSHRRLPPVPHTYGQTLGNHALGCRKGARQKRADRGLIPATILPVLLRLLPRFLLRAQNRIDRSACRQETCHQPAGSNPVTHKTETL